MTISGQKGGIGKSVIAVNLSTSLALYEKKTLLIDCDPQASTTEWSGIKDLGYPFDLASVLNGKSRLLAAAVKTEFNWLDILPAGFELFSSAARLAKMTPNETLLRRLIREDAGSDYDFIILDAPSSYGFLSTAALAAADWLISPLCPGVNSAGDFHCLLKLINYIRKQHDIPLKIGGFVLNRCRESGVRRDFFMDEHLAEIKDLVYDTVIPEDTSVEKAINRKTPLALYDIKSPASSAFLSFAKEIDLVFK